MRLLVLYALAGCFLLFSVDVMAGPGRGPRGGGTNALQGNAFQNGGGGQFRGGFGQFGRQGGQNFPQQQQRQMRMQNGQASNNQQTSQSSRNTDCQQLFAQLMQLDQNGDGVITKNEVSNPQLHPFFRRADQNQNGQVTAGELMRQCQLPLSGQSGSQSAQQNQNAGQVGTMSRINRQQGIRPQGMFPGISRGGMPPAGMQRNGFGPGMGGGAGNFGVMQGGGRSMPGFSARGGAHGR